MRQSRARARRQAAVDTQAAGFAVLAVAALLVLPAHPAHPVTVSRSVRSSPRAYTRDQDVACPASRSGAEARARAAAGHRGTARAAGCAGASGRSPGHDRAGGHVRARSADALRRCAETLPLRHGGGVGTGGGPAEAGRVGAAIEPSATSRPPPSTNVTIASRRWRALRTRCGRPGSRRRSSRCRLRGAGAVGRDVRRRTFVRRWCAGHATAIRSASRRRRRRTARRWGRWRA
jgi:hypothetical protein